MNKPWDLKWIVAASVLMFAATTLPAARPMEAESRERIFIGDGWRFTKGDPTNPTPGNLLYDARPVSRGEDRRPSPAEATEDPAKLGAATQPVLKPWILPTGNQFIKDPAQRFTRPEGIQRPMPRGDSRPSWTSRQHSTDRNRGRSRDRDPDR